MNIVYYADDGKAFTNRNSCEKYEEKLKSLALMPKMYDCRGRETKEVGDAEIVIMESKFNYEPFIKACEGVAPYDGIDVYDFCKNPVYYVWYEYDERFIRMTTGLLNIIDKAREKVVDFSRLV